MFYGKFMRFSKSCFKVSRKAELNARSLMCCTDIPDGPGLFAEEADRIQFLID